MKFTSFKHWINENKNNKNITVLLPGGFKPFHAAHVDLVKRYSELPEVKKVLVLIGPGVRNGIDQKLSLEISKELLGHFKNVEVEAVKYPSPVLTVYKYIETAKPGTYAMAAVKKGKDDEDYKRVLKFVENFNPGGKYYNLKPEGVNVVELDVNTKPIYYQGRTDDNDGKSISASVLRQDILNDDYENFKTNYPGYTEYVTRKLWNMLKPVVVEGIEFKNEDEINEKFSEESDPVHDMGIGLNGLIKKYMPFWIKERWRTGREATPNTSQRFFKTKNYPNEAYTIFYILYQIEIDNNQLKIKTHKDLQNIVKNVIKTELKGHPDMNINKILKVLNNYYHMNVTYSKKEK